MGETGRSRTQPRRRLARALAAGALGLALLLGLAAWVDVDRSPGPADRAAIAEMLRRAGYAELADFPRPSGFAAQLETVRAVQDAVLAAAPRDRGIPLGQEREPAALLRLGYGLCYDRSRAIEKALALFGLETRHASLYGTAEGGALEALLTPGSDSHALTEVRTTRGWMTVDSNARWIGVAAGGEPLALGEIGPAEAASVPAADAPEPPTPLIVRSHVALYGLYSRHGRFYPPFAPFPDVDFRQFLRYSLF